MRLNPGERSILAGFTHESDAAAALAELKQKGFADVQLDRFSEHGYDPEPDTRRPALGGGEPTLSGSVLYGHTATTSDDTRVLLAAMPAVSGMSGEVPHQPPFLVTAVTSDDRVEEALAIVRRYGGDA